MKRSFTALMIMALSSQLATAQIDLHSHMIPDSYLEAVKAHGMEMDEGFPIPSWSADAHLAFMDEAGIRTSVLSRTWMPPSRKRNTRWKYLEPTESSSPATATANIWAPKRWSP